MRPSLAERSSGQVRGTSDAQGWVWIAQLPLDRAQPVPVRGDPAGAFEPLDQGWAHFVQRLW